MLPYASGEIQCEVFAHSHLAAWLTRGIVPESATTTTPERNTT